MNPLKTIIPDPPAPPATSFLIYHDPNGRYGSERCLGIHLLYTPSIGGPERVLEAWARARGLTGRVWAVSVAAEVKL